MVGLAEALVAGLVAGDEQVGVDHRGEAVDGLGLGVPAPGQGVDGPAAAHRLGGPDVGLEDVQVEPIEVAIGSGIVWQRKTRLGVRTASGSAAKRS